MAETIEELLFKLRVDASQLDNLAPAVTEELLQAARAASNFNVDEAVFVRAGEQMGASVLRGLQSYLNGKGIDVASLFTGDLSKAIDKSGVERVQRELTQASSRAQGRVQSDPALASQSAELQRLIARRDQLERASVPRAPLENVGGQPTFRRGQDLAKLLGIEVKPSFNAAGNLNQAGVRETLSSARTSELSSLTRQIESLSGSLQRSISTPSGEGARALAANLDRLAPAFDRAGQAKDRFIVNLEKLQRVFDAISSSASTAAGSVEGAGARRGRRPTATAAAGTTDEVAPVTRASVKPKTEAQRELEELPKRAQDTTGIAPDLQKILQDPLANLQRTLGRVVAADQINGAPDSDFRGSGGRFDQAEILSLQGDAARRARAEATANSAGVQRLRQTDEQGNPLYSVDQDRFNDLARLRVQRRDNSDDQQLRRSDASAAFPPLSEDVQRLTAFADVARAREAQLNRTAGQLLRSGFTGSSGNSELDDALKTQGTAQSRAAVTEAQRVRRENARATLPGLSEDQQQLSAFAAELSARAADRNRTARALAENGFVGGTGSPELDDSLERANQLRARQAATERVRNARDAGLGSRGQDPTDVLTESAGRAGSRKALLNAAEKSLQPLEQEVELEQQIAALEARRATARRNLARAEAAGAQLSPVAAASLNDDDRRRARTFTDRQKRLANQQDTQEELREYVQRDDVGPVQKAAAIVRNRAPGSTRSTQPSIGERFTGGFLGDRLDPIEQIGQTLRFSTFYGGAYTVLSGLEQAFSQATQGALQYEDALKNLEISTNNTKEENEALATSLSKIGTSTGFGSAVGVQVGQTNVGLYDLSQSSEEDQSRIAGNATAVALRLARLGNSDPQVVATQLAGTIRAFGLSDQSQSQVEDIASVVSKRSGVSASDLLSATGAIGTLAQGAGYDLPSTLALISQVRSSTGQSPDAVAGYLSQVFSKANDPAAEARLAAVGVNTNGTTLAEQFDQLRSLGLPKEQLDQIVQAFGRGRSGQALQVILRQGGQIDELADSARNAPAGSGEAMFGTLTNFNFGEQLKRLGTDFQALVNELVKTGLVNFLFLVVEAARGVVNLMTNVVSAFNLIPSPLRQVIVGLGELYLALRLIAALKGATAVATIATSLGARVTGAVAASRAAALGTAGAAGGNLLGAAGASALARTAVVPAGFTRAASGLLVPTEGVLAGGVGAGFAGAATRTASTSALAGGAIAGRAISSGLSTFFRSLVTRIAIPLGVISGVAGASGDTAALKASAQEANDATRSAGSVDALRAAAAAQRGVVAQSLDDQKLLKFSSLATLGIEPLYNKLPFSGAAQRQAAARTAADNLDTQATVLATAASDAEKANPANTFSDFSSTDSVATAMSTLATRGLNATQALDALNGAFDSLITRSQAVGTNVAAYIAQGQGPQFAQQYGGQAAGEAVTQTRDFLTNEANGINPGGDDTSFLGVFKNLPETAGQVLHGIGGIFGLGDGGFGDITSAFGGGQARTDRDAADILSNSDPSKVNKAVSDSVTSTLDALGKNPAAGPVSLSDDDLTKIRENAKKALAGSIKGFDKLPKEIQKQLLDTYVNDTAAAIGGDFTASTITPANVAAYVQNATQGAEAVGSRTAGLSRDSQAGTTAQLGALQTERQKVAAALASAKANGSSADDINAIQTSLDNVDIAINGVLETAISQRSAEIDRVTAIAQASRGLDDTVGRQADTIAGLTQKLNDPTLTGKERDTLTAQLGEANKQQDQNKLAERQGARTAEVNPRNQQESLQAQLANVNDALALATPGSANASQLATQQNEILAQMTDYSLDLLQAVEIYAAGRNKQQGLQAALNDANRRLAQAKVDNDPVALAQASTAAAEAQTALGAYNLDLQQAQGANDQPGNQQVQLNQAVSDAQRRLTDAKAGGDPLEIQRAQTALYQAQRGVTQYSLSLASATRAATQPQNTTVQLNNAVIDARQALADARATGDPQAIQKALTDLSNANAAIATNAVKEASAYRAARRDPLDSRQALLDAAQDARDELARLTKTPGQFSQADINTQKAAVRSADANTAKYDLDLRAARNELTASPGDRIGNARVAVQNAQAEVNFYASRGLQNTIEFVRAQKALQDSLYQFAQTQEEVIGQTARRTGVDLTDPLVQARIAVDDLTAKQRLAPTPEEAAAVQPDIDKARSDQALAAIDKQTKDITDAHDLKRTTDSEYINSLQAEYDGIQAQLAAMDKNATGYQALKDKSIEIAKIIQSATESLNSQFNLNNVTLPTVYEVRRAVGATADQMRSKVVDYTSSQGTVIINGADMTQVISYINQTLGTGSSAVYTTQPRRTY